MTRLTSLFLIIIFFLSLFIGITVGVTFKQGQKTPTPTTASSPIANETIGSLLVLGVNNFEDEEIYLESAWQVILSKTQRDGNETIDVVMVSIYPPANNKASEPNIRPYLEPHPPISFPKSYLEDLSVFNVLNRIPILNRSEIYFQDVIVIDEYAMNFIIELTNSEPVLPPDSINENSFIKPWEAPQEALDLQRNILDTLCSPPQNILSYANFIHVFSLYPEKFKTNLTIEEIIGFWQLHFDKPIPPVVNCRIYT
jgi:hypothetical protein